MADLRLFGLTVAHGACVFQSAMRYGAAEPSARLVGASVLGLLERTAWLRGEAHRPMLPAEK